MRHARAGTSGCPPRRLRPEESSSLRPESRAALRGRRSRAHLVVLVATLLAAAATAADATVYYVRQAAGDDGKDGRSPATAWKHVDRLSPVLRAGDTAYVGPGSYREQIDVEQSGTPEAPITLVADTSGQHTGDAPGPVVLIGSDPVDESLFKSGDAPGVFRATMPDAHVGSVVEMDGPQRRYLNVAITREFIVDKLAPADIVAQKRSSYAWDEPTRTLVIHTSDDRPPTAHELETVHRFAGVLARGRPYVTVVGFTVRHVQDGGISFFAGSNGGTVVGVTVWGSRQGVRVHGTSGVLVYGSTLFRNENSGIYFAAGSSGGRAIGNVLYENTAKGLRWSSSSNAGLGVDNVVFDNDERGIAIEETDDVVLRGNRMVGNGVSQLLVMNARYSSDANCFATTAPSQLVADFRPFTQQDAFPTLAAYRTAKPDQEHASHDGGCGTLPARVDVRTLGR